MDPPDNTGQPNSSRLLLHDIDILAASDDDEEPAWSNKKEYVRKVTGHGGTYQANKAKRMSDSIPWPRSPVDTGIYCTLRSV